MLLGADLGWLLPSVVVVVVVVGWFVTRRKWRRSVARRQEIKRLLALASEETARAEHEAVATYCSYEEEPMAVAPGSSPQRQVQYQCEVCFSPTTTRCKRCKAVHYCSGKCQIIHWRQGHRDECSSFSSHRSNDVVLLKQDEFQSSDNLNDNTVANNYGGKETGKIAKASVDSLPDEQTSSTILSDMPIASSSNMTESNQFEAVKPLLSKQSISTSLVQDAATPGVSLQFKSGCVDTDKLAESSISLGSDASRSEEIPLSEPSTPSSDFWEATVEPIRSKIDAPDKLRVIKDQNSCSSCFSSKVRSDAHMEVLGFGMNKVMTDTLSPASIATNPTHEAALSEKGNKDCLKSRGPILLDHQVPTHLNVKNTSPGWSSKMEVAKSSFSGTCLEHKDSESKGHAPNKDDVEVRGLQYLAPKILKSKIDRTFANSDVMECRVNDYLTLKDSKTGMPPSGCTRKHVFLDVQSVKNGGDRGCDVHNAKSCINAPTRRVKDQLQASSSFRQSYLGSKIGPSGKYEGLFSYEHFVQLYNWNKVELRPCGLINCGNSCYANAVLQCLVFTPPLTAYFLQGLHSKTCGKREWCFTCEFELLVNKAKEGNSPMSPAAVLSQMERLGSRLGHGREEDAHEFLRYAIDAMQFVHLKEARFNKLNSLDEATLVGLTFGGYLRSKIECMRCGGKSEQHERIMDLSVEIGGDIGTVEEALHQFTRSEILDGENKYQCGRCKSYEKAKKKLRVLEAPNVLTIALKRFQSGQYGKLNKVVKFPEVLNLAPYMSGTSDKSPIYRLYGVVVHLDSMNATFSGHYVCYLKNNAERWFKADDMTVQPVELGKVLSTAAYMLFYARCSPRSPKLRKSGMIPLETRKVRSETCRCKFHQAEQWDATHELICQTCNDCFYQHCSRYPLARPKEEDVSSDNSSSIFSEAGSYSTESSNRESTSTDDSFDQMLGDLGNHLNKSWRSSSDSDTSSPSSSPSPLYTRHSPLSDLDRYSSDTETSGSNLVKSSSKGAVSIEKKRCSFSSPNPHTRLVGSNSCCYCSRENDSNRRVVGCNNSRENLKSVHLRRSIR